MEALRTTFTKHFLEAKPTVILAYTYACEIRTKAARSIGEQVT